MSASSLTPVKNITIKIAFIPLDFDVAFDGSIGMGDEPDAVFCRERQPISYVVPIVV